MSIWKLQRNHDYKVLTRSMFFLQDVAKGARSKQQVPSDLLGSDRWKVTRALTNAAEILCGAISRRARKFQHAWRTASSDSLSKHAKVSNFSLRLFSFDLSLIAQIRNFQVKHGNDWDGVINRCPSLRNSMKM